ncbi:MAG TPA: immunoglobulin domain-containing protein, partial [Verrucomicrobiae bacterium]
MNRTNNSLLVWALLALATGISLPAHSQGTVNFSNNASGVNAPDFDVNCITKLSGSTFSASLYASPNPDPASMVAIGAPVSFQTGGLAGYYNGGARTIPSVPPGGAAYCQVRVWQTSCGATFEQAVATGPGCKRGVSSVISVVTGLVGPPPPNLVGLQSFCLVTSQPPTISDITNKVTNENTPTAAIPFTLSDDVTPATNLTVSGSSSNLALVPNANIVFGGSGSNRTVTITPAANQSGTATITLCVSDGESTTCDSFVLTVRQAPRITTQPQSRTVVQGANYTFSATAIGAAPLNYQWRFNGSSVPGGTNSTLPRTNIQFSDAGNYLVVVSNVVGVVTSVLATLTVRSTNDPVYAPPNGGWTYLYDGSWTTVTNGTNIGGPKPAVTLDGQWSANNGSCEWAGDARGTNNGPLGGISTNNGILTIEDINLTTGSNNNRKIYFTRDFSRDTATTNAGRIFDQGITLTFRTRLTQPGVFPASDNPTNSLPDGYGIFSDGKANFNVRQRGADSIIGFSLVRSNEPDNTIAFTAPGLTMNSLRGNVPSGNGFVNSGASAGSNQVLALDPNQFHEFWITIQTNRTGGPGTHTVDIYRDGSLLPTTFNL